MRRNLAGKWWWGFCVLALVGLLSSPAAAQVQVIASGLIDPFSLVVTGADVWWTEGQDVPDCWVNRHAKDGSGSTYGDDFKCGWISGLPDLAQDDTKIYLPALTYPPSVTGAVNADIMYFDKLSGTGSNLFKFEVLSGPV